MSLPLVSIRRYFRELEDAHILTFEAFDFESQKKLKEILDRTKNAFALERAYQRDEPVIIKPEGASLVYKYNKVYFYYKDFTFCVELTDDLLDLLAEEQLSNCFMKLSLTKRKAVSKTKAIYFAEIEAIYQAEYDYDRAKELLKEYPAWILLTTAIGYKPEPASFGLRFAQLISLYSFNDRAIHTLTLTAPRSGKSRTAKIISGLSRSSVTVLPTPAKLVYDGRFGRYGLAYFNDTIYIDEFDKIKSGKRRDQFKESYEILLNGMSDGLWSREIASKVSDYIRLVSLCFMGNIKDRELEDYTLSGFAKTTREKLAEIFSFLDIDLSPFIERLTYIEFNTASLQAYELLNYAEDNTVLYLDPKIARAVIELTKEEVLKQSIAKKPKCELDQHFNAIKAVLKVLGIELEDALIEDLVNGKATAFELLSKPEVEKEQTEVDKEELKEEEEEAEEGDVEAFNWDLSEALKR